MVSQVVASVAELVLWKVTWKSLIKLGKVPKEEASKALWVWTVA